MAHNKAKKKGARTLGDMTYGAAAAADYGAMPEAVNVRPRTLGSLVAAKKKKGAK